MALKNERHSDGSREARTDGSNTDQQMGFDIGIQQ